MMRIDVLVYALLKYKWVLIWISLFYFKLAHYHKLGSLINTSTCPHHMAFDHPYYDSKLTLMIMILFKVHSYIYM